MKRYIIEEAKCGISDGGMASSVVGSVKFKEDGSKNKWLNLVEIEGTANYSLTDKDIFDKLILEDEETLQTTGEHPLTEFNGIELNDDFFYNFTSLQENDDNPAAPLIRYLIALVRCEPEDLDDLLSLADGSYADEMDIPLSDLEEEYLEELEDEEDDDYDEEEDEGEE